MKTILICAPATSRSGYGDHARDLIHSLLDMKKFNTLKGIPASLPMINVDTDMIIPKQFLKTIKRTGLGKNLFFELRYDDKGNEIKDFILNNKDSIFK